jgi:hypothetical protein
MLDSSRKEEDRLGDGDEDTVGENGNVGVESGGGGVPASLLLSNEDGMMLLLLLLLLAIGVVEWCGLLVLLHALREPEETGECTCKTVGVVLLVPFDVVLVVVE